MAPRKARSKTQGDLSSDKKKISFSKTNCNKSSASAKKCVLLGGNSQDDHKFCGYGRRFYPHSGDRHEGHYLDGKRQGLGVYLWGNGDKYSGDWTVVPYLKLKDLMNGRGLLEWANGEIYNGEWENGVMCGKGMKVQADGSKIIGNFKAGLPHGRAKKYFIEGDIYDGNFDNGKRAGYGEYIWAIEDCMYRGGWVNDLMHGIGQFIASNKHNGKSNISGNNCSNNGRKSVQRRITRCASNSVTATKIILELVISYSGEFCNGRLCGSGTAVLSDGSQYTGEWSNDQYNGWGHIEYLDGSSYDGEFLQGMRQGQGQYCHHTDNEQINGSGDTTTLVVTPFEAPFEEYDFNIDWSTITAATAIDDDVSGASMMNDNNSNNNHLMVYNILHTWGGTYLGDWLNDHPHGMGSIALLNGQILSSILRNQVYRGKFAAGMIVQSTN